MAHLKIKVSNVSVMEVPLHLMEFLRRGECSSWLYFSSLFSRLSVYNLQGINNESIKVKTTSKDTAEATISIN